MCSETSLNSHDPEECVTLVDLSLNDLSPDSTTPLPIIPVTEFHPYLNESSFQLSHWYWNGRVQKSQQSLTELVNIVGLLTFKPDDVHGTKWDTIDAKLGNNVAEGAVSEWLDEDAGWKKTSIKISVPFASRMDSSGAGEYISNDQYHHSLVEVIQERLSDPHTNKKFHMEPYKLLWQRSEKHEEVRLHGEMYTSEAFCQAHRDLQESPPEPDCELECIVVSMMFWLDSTHLTSFGNSHL